jgi:hypothetical protein
MAPSTVGSLDVARIFLGPSAERGVWYGRDSMSLCGSFWLSFRYFACQELPCSEAASCTSACRFIIRHEGGVQIDSEIYDCVRLGCMSALNVVTRPLGGSYMLKQLRPCYNMPRSGYLTLACLRAASIHLRV